MIYLECERCKMKIKPEHSFLSYVNGVWEIQCAAMDDNHPHQHYLYFQQLRDENIIEELREKMWFPHSEHTFKIKRDTILKAANGQTMVK